jgi:hypothetical protein
MVKEIVQKDERTPANPYTHFADSGLNVMFGKVPLITLTLTIWI